MPWALDSVKNIIFARLYVNNIITPFYICIELMPWLHRVCVMFFFFFGNEEGIVTQNGIQSDETLSQVQIDCKVVFLMPHGSRYSLIANVKLLNPILTSKILSLGS